MRNVIVWHTTLYARFYNRHVYPVNRKIYCSYLAEASVENSGTDVAIDFRINSNRYWIVRISRSMWIKVVVEQNQVKERNLLFFKQ